MPTVGERVNELRKERKETLEAVGKAIGVSRQYISNIEHDHKEPGRDTLRALADHFNVDIDYLIGNTDIRRKVDLTGLFEEGYSQGVRDTEERTLAFSAVTMAPIYSRISCGTGTWIDEEPCEMLGIPSEWTQPTQTYFANAAEGDSMEPLIHHGDYLVFEQCDQVPFGMIGAFSLNDQYYCKRIKRLADGSVWLFSENHAYDPIPIHPDDTFRVIGIYRFNLSKAQ